MGNFVKRVQKKLPHGAYDSGYSADPKQKKLKGFLISKRVAIVGSRFMKKIKNSQNSGTLNLNSSFPCFFVVFKWLCEKKLFRLDSTTGYNYVF